MAGSNQIVASAIHWGEVASIAYKKHGSHRAIEALSRLISLGFRVIPVAAERAVHSGCIKTSKKIPYADAIGVDLASDSADHILLTADFDVVPAKDQVRIEFLPPKRKR